MKHTNLKRLFSLLSCLILLGGMLVISLPSDKAEAATVSFRSTNAGVSQGRLTLEKVGNYYFRVECVSNVYRIKYSSSRNGAGKTLKSVSSPTYYIDSQIVTNGNDVYFSVHRTLYNNPQHNVYDIIFKASISAGKIKKICTVKNFAHLEGYYNGRIYYTKYASNYASESITSLYRYNISTGKTALTVSKYNGCGSYGYYFLGQRNFDVSQNNQQLCIYNAKTAAVKNPNIKANMAVITSNRIIYIKTSGSGSSTYSTMYRSTLDGRTRTTLLASVNRRPEYQLTRRGNYFSFVSAGRVWDEFYFNISDRTRTTVR